MQQDRAAIATTFADDGDKLSKGGRTGVAVLKGVASIAAAVAPAGLARIVGRTARAGTTVAREVEVGASSDARAITRPESGAKQLTPANKALGAEPIPVPAASKAEAAATVVEGKSGSSGGSVLKSKAETAPGTPLEKARGTADHSVPPTETKTGGPGAKATDLDAEFVGGPHRDPKSLSKAEVEQARRTVVEDFERISKKKLPPLKYTEVALPAMLRSAWMVPP